MALIENSGSMGNGTILTSPNDPLRLTVCHLLDKASYRATLQFEAYNPLPLDLEGVTIRCVKRIRPFSTCMSMFYSFAPQ